MWMGIGLEHQPPHPGAQFGTKDPFARIGEQHLLDLLADMTRVEPARVFPTLKQVICVKG